MNNRERIINTVLCREVDRLPFIFYFPPWEETKVRWEKEGMTGNWDDNLGQDPGIVLLSEVNLGFCPAFEEKVIEEKGDNLILVDNMGVTKEVRKTGSSIPKYLDYPVKCRDDWEKLKLERLDPDDPRRFPEDWRKTALRYNKEDKAVQLGSWPYGLFGTLRELMGVEEFLVSFYEQPELIRDMMDYLTDFWICIYEKVCRDVRVDCIHIWEDMSGCSGSLVSPGMVREFMMPNYKKIKAFAEKKGIPVFSLDTDGDCSELVPLFMECGINLVFPFEVAAGCDIVQYRRKYPMLGILGGIDKRELAKGRKAIDRELDRVAVMFQGSGYIPSIDHFFHPEISWKNFNYFAKRLKELIGVSRS